MGTKHTDNPNPLYPRARLLNSPGNVQALPGKPGNGQIVLGLVHQQRQKCPEHSTTDCAEEANGETAACILGVHDCRA